MRAIITVVARHWYTATLDGQSLGTFRSERAAREAILRVMRERYGLIPRDGAAAYLGHADELGVR
jgi:hypothetical protein